MKTTVVRVLGLAAMMVSVWGCAGDQHGVVGESERGERVLFNQGWTFYREPNPDESKGPEFYQGIKSFLLPTGNAFRSELAVRPTSRPVPVLKEAAAGFDDSSWKKLNLPHDWAIEGPFKYEYDGSTGKLPYWGVGWYRKTFTASKVEGKRVYLELDGAMSYSTVWVNGKLAGGWPYGYATYRVDVTDYLKVDGGENVVAVRLENPAESSRWYPGAGLYRNVWMVTRDEVGVAQWGVAVTTPEVSKEKAKVVVEAEVENSSDRLRMVMVKNEVFEADEQGKPRGRAVAVSTLDQVNVSERGNAKVRQVVEIKSPRLWDMNSPQRYVAVTSVYPLAMGEARALDVKETRFGVRTAEFKVNDGFHLNGRRVQIQGVCMHHDLGALGAAVNWRALERQLEMLKEMGVNAIRTSHNPPTPELVELCDRMGLVMQVEAFDCWKRGKRGKDYTLLWEDWREADIRSMVRHYRNAPSVIMWSIGNEIPDAGGPQGAGMARELVKWVKMEDATRPTSVASNRKSAGFNGVQEAVDVFGINYFLVPYDEFREKNPNKPYHASETSSALSTRGEYFFGKGRRDWMSDFQVSGYDLSKPGWGQTPDEQFKVLDERPWVGGEFVWTGFDYLGEPTPYNDDSTVLLNYTDPVAREKAAKELETIGKIRVPSRSSYFGIIDLAGFKKDRFYLYQARWRSELPMAHVLPHWTWPGREGEVTPVHVYTSGDEAELFVNGVSMGRKAKGKLEYRIVWPEVKYAPGTVEVVAYKGGKVWAKDTVKTAGAAAKLEIGVDRAEIVADGKDLAFIEVSVKDGVGTEVPRAKNKVKFSVSGPAEIVATDNGDPTSFVPFASHEKEAFNGKVMVIVKMTGKGTAVVKAESDGLVRAEVKVVGK